VVAEDVQGVSSGWLSGEADEMPEVLSSNYFRASPNPFNPQTQLQFGLIKAGNVTIDIYDLQGRRVTQVQNGYLSAGHHTIEWRGRDSANRGVSSGVYFVRLVGDDFQLKQKILLVR